MKEWLGSGEVKCDEKVEGSEVGVRKTMMG